MPGQYDFIVSLSQSREAPRINGVDRSVAVVPMGIRFSAGVVISNSFPGDNPMLGGRTRKGLFRFAHLRLDFLTSDAVDAPTDSP